MKYPYSSGLELGPHGEEIKHPSRFSRVIKRVRSEVVYAVSHAHHLSYALLLIAFLSLGANFAFGYLAYVNHGINPQISFFGLGEGKAMGSDDADNSEPTFPIIDASSTHFSLIDNPATLNVSAESYIVADAETGEVLVEKNAGTQYPIASVTKLMTAIVAKEHMDLHHTTVVSDYSHNAYGSEGQLATGEKILVSDLFYPLLMESSNDAAEVLADDFGRDNFIDLMNQKASSIEMDNTSYEDPSGLSAHNVSTAQDLLRLAFYVRAQFPELLDITRVKQYSIIDHTWTNKNAMLTYPNFLGGKNGFINESKKTTLSYFNVSFRGNDPDSKAISRPLALVLLRSDDRDADTALLLSYISKNIRYEREDTE